MDHTGVRSHSISRAPASAASAPSSLLDQVQRQVDAGRDARGGDDVAVVDDALALADVGAELAQVLDRGVMGDRGAAAQDAGLGQQHRAGADAADPAAGGVTLGERLRDHAAARLGPRAGAAAVVPAAAGDEHEVGIAEHAVGDDRRAVGGAHALLRLDRDEAGVQPGLAQHLERPERVEVVEPVEQQDLDGHAEDGPAGRAIRRVAGMPMFVTIQPRCIGSSSSRWTRSSRSTSRSRRRCSGPTSRRRTSSWSAAPPPGPVRTSAGFEIVAQAGPEALASADTVLVPGFEPHLRVPEAPVLDALRAAHARGARMVSICTGAFALAAAGVLDGRRATTHWRDAADLAARYPRVDVEPGVLYIDEGQVLTSAGVAAGLDLCLHILRRDHGAALANTIARRIVVPPHREGGQAQYVEQPVPETAGGSLADDPRLGARAPARAADGPRARRPRPRLRAHVRPPLQRRDRRPGPALAARPARRRRPRRARGHRRVDRRDRPPLRLRHRREPAQALPPRRPDDADRLPPAFAR